MTNTDGSSIITHAFDNKIRFKSRSYGITSSEKYSRGRRGAPAKGVGRATGARVRIPLSPFCLKITFEKTLKKLLTSKKIYDNISELLFERFKKATKNNLKKLLTNMKHFDII